MSLLEGRWVAVDGACHNNNYYHDSIMIKYPIVIIIIIIIVIIIIVIIIVIMDCIYYINYIMFVTCLTLGSDPQDISECHKMIYVFLKGICHFQQNSNQSGIQDSKRFAFSLSWGHHESLSSVLERVRALLHQTCKFRSLEQTPHKLSDPKASWVLWFVGWGHGATCPEDWELYFADTSSTSRLDHLM